MSNNIVRGTMLLTGATFLSKFLGMIYVIPFNELVGETGGALFQFAYNPYNILLTISTVSVPVAVSKFVSKYNSLRDYETGMRMFKAGIIMMLITGFLAFLALFFGAEFLAKQMITGDDAEGITVADITMVLKMVSFALIIIPAMSIVRGFFQGHQSMGPTAVSQVVEQIARIIFLLTATFIVIKVYNGTIAMAVGFATFATFIGAIGSCFVLWIYWRRRKGDILRKVQEQAPTKNYVPTRDLFAELFSYAGPFVLLGLATPLYQLVDQFTFERAMVAIGELSWKIPFGAINFLGHKLVVIPVTIATGLSLAILPALTKTFTQNNRTLLNKQINQALQIVLVLVIPAVAGLVMLSDVAYGSLFGLDNIDITGPLLAWYAPVALLFALYTVSTSILQGINEQKFAVVSLAAGLLLKILLNIQLIHTFGAKGIIFGTALATSTAVLLNMWRVKKTIKLPFKQTFKQFLLISIFTILMCVAIWIVKYLFGMIMPYEESRLASIIMLLIGVGTGGIVYLWLGYQSTLLERVLGNRVKVLDRFIRRF